MLLLYEIRKTTGNSILRVTAAMLFLVCLLLSYYSVKTDNYESVSSEQLQNSYDYQMQRYINSAEQSRKQLENLGREGDYAHKYYDTVIDMYTEASSGKTIEHGSADGWDRLLSSDMILLLSLAMSVVIGGISVLEEKRTETALLIFATVNGRLKTAVSKALTVVVLASLSCVAFTSVFAAFFFFSGHLSSGMAELQTAESFLYSPYNITLRQGLLRITGGRILVSVSFGMAAAVLSELSGSYALISAAAVLPIGAEYLFFRTVSTGVDHFLKNVNVFSVGGSFLLQRYYSVRFFGCRGASGVGTAIFLILFAAESVLFILLFSKRRKMLNNTKKRKESPKSRKRKRAVSERSLFGWEWQKNLFTPFTVAALLICPAVFLAVAVNTYGNRGNTDEMIYRDYCDKYGSLPISGAMPAISEEKTRIERGLMIRTEAEELFEKGEITPDVYSSMMNEYGYCLAHKLAVERIYERAVTLDGLDKRGAPGIRLVYDKALNSLLEENFSFVFVMLVIVCLSPLFSREYESGMINMLHTCKKGRKKLFFAKLLFAVSFTSLCFLIYTAVDLAVCAGAGAFSDADASVRSLAPSVNAVFDISIGRYIVLLYSVRFAAFVLFAVILASVSAITGKTMSTSILAAVIVFIPFILGRYGIIPDAFNITALFSANRILLTGEISAVDFIILPVSAALLSIISARRFRACE